MQQRTRVVKLSAPARPQGQDTQKNHQHFKPDHHAKSPEDYRRVRPVLVLEVLRRRNLAVPGMRQNQAAEVRNFKRKVVFLGSRVVPAKQHYAEKSGFQKERGQHLVGQQRPGDAASKIGEKAPVGAELVSHDLPRHHAHAEVDSKNLRPEMMKIAKHSLPVRSKRALKMAR